MVGLLMLRLVGYSRITDTSQYLHQAHHKLSQRVSKNSKLDGLEVFRQQARRSGAKARMQCSDVLILRDSQAYSKDEIPEPSAEHSIASFYIVPCDSSGR